ncbi:acyltransferase family protein [Paeniglutamicibacter sp. MACA_103]|uniref:acyltransferase family protein n=1 Tax=Paeniglutamicibacter sp. MACA_103 TaxID=3377337 RepID=UPI003894DE70
MSNNGTALLDASVTATRKQNVDAAGASAQRPPRLALLDGLRFAAAALVVLFHYTAWHHGFWGTAVAKDAWPVLSKVTVYGNMGVQLFFIISGFVILLSAYGKGAGRFVGSRVGRLYPAYWFAVLATGFLVIVMWPQLGSGLGAKELLANLTMFHPLMELRHIDGVYWTLWVEMRFYLLILALIILRLLTIRYMTILAVAWPVLGLAAQLMNREVAAGALMSEYAPLFCGGIMLFMIYRFGHSALRWSVLALNVGVAAYFTGVKGTSEALELVGYVIPAWHYWVIVVGLFAAVALLSLTRLGNVQWKFLGILGALTYPVYLLHQIWGWWMIDHFAPVLGQYATLPLVMGIVFLAAFMVNRFIERPLAKPLAAATTKGLGYLGGRLALKKKAEAPVPGR